MTIAESIALSPEHVVVAYHERTKHHYSRYAASLGYLDWANQPNPFRRYEGAPLIHLPFPETGRTPRYWQLYAPDDREPAPLSVDSMSLFFRFALSLTAWKQFQGSTWPLRVNPSSGNLHPTEGYALLPALHGIHDRPGVYHYAAKEHGLELRADLDPSVWAASTAGFPEGSFLVGLSSILWREAWKYGERAFRYCQHDTGHALGTMRFAAAALGWKLRLLDRGVTQPSHDFSDSTARLITETPNESTPNSWQLWSGRKSRRNRPATGPAACPMSWCLKWPILDGSVEPMY